MALASGQAAGVRWAGRRRSVEGDAPLRHRGMKVGLAMSAKDVLPRSEMRRSPSAAT